MRVLATYSIKGGVGKTTAAVNLAHEAAHAGARVLVWDLDPQGAATFLLRVKPAVKGGADRMVGSRGELARHLRATELPAVNAVPADFSMRNLDVHLDGVKQPQRRLAQLLEPLAQRFDVAFLDCPPSISLASESVFGAADALLVPTVPTALSSRTLAQLTRFLATWDGRPIVLPFLSMLDRRKKLQREIAARLAAEWPALLPTAIPSAGVVERMGTERGPLGTFAPGTGVARAYRELWADIARRIW